MEITDVNRFFNTTTPFCYLDESALATLVKAVTVFYCRAKESVDISGDRLLIVRSGVFLTAEDPAAYLQEGDCYGYAALLGNETDKSHVRCEEDGLIYWLPAATFKACCQNSRHFSGYFQGLSRRNLHQYHEPQAQPRITLKIEQVIKPLKFVIAPEQTIAAAARLMTNHRVSSLLVEKNSQLVGIVTDRDLRSRVLAKEIPATTPVQNIMSPSPFCIDKGAYLFEAVQTMAQYNIHHLPVLDRGRSYGMITLSDIVRAQQGHPVYLIGEIHRQQELTGLQNCAAQLTPLLHQLALQRVPAQEVSHIITTVTDALTQSLIRQAIQHLGEPPCGYCWLAFGSQARMDQSINADQDNALVLAEEPDGEIGEYFALLAQRVCQGLAQCGIPLCPGNIMATNDDLRLSLEGWQKKFTRFIDSPHPQAILDSTIFFDLRCINGDAALAAQLQHHILQRSHNNELFLFHMARTASERTPALGMLRNFILQETANGEKGIDLKKRGLSLITELVRVYALAHGIDEVNTSRRLQCLMEKGALDKNDAQNLLDAADIMMQLRWQKHQQHLLQRTSVNNLVNPAELPVLQRNQLKDSFNVVAQAQARMQNRFCRTL